MTTKAANSKANTGTAEGPIIRPDSPEDKALHEAVVVPPYIEDPRLAELRKPFPDNEVSARPVGGSCNACKNAPTKACDQHPKRSCNKCGGYHATSMTHLDYVGHAEVTDRLLAVDPHWNWEPMALTPEGIPVMTRDGGLWMKVTVAGVTRIGYGDAPGKSGGDAIKETIGDGIRNAMMRQGVALDLWRKTDRLEVAAATNVPDEPAGQVIGHGDFRMTVDQWRHRVMSTVANNGQESAKAVLSDMWVQAGFSAEMKDIVTEGINAWKVKWEDPAQQSPQGVEGGPSFQPPAPGDSGAAQAGTGRDPGSTVPPREYPPEITRARAIWRGNYDKAKDGNKQFSLEDLIRRASNAGWADFEQLARDELADIKEAMLLQSQQDPAAVAAIAAANAVGTDRAVRDVQDAKRVAQDAVRHVRSTEPDEARQ